MVCNNYRYTLISILLYVVTLLMVPAYVQ